MLITEWNWDDAKEVWQEEAWEDGMEEGLKKGRKSGLEEGLKNGLKKGHEEVIKLLEQGLSTEEIKKRLGKNPG